MWSGTIPSVAVIRVVGVSNRTVGFTLSFGGTWAGCGTTIHHDGCYVWLQRRPGSAASLSACREVWPSGRSEGWLRTPAFVVNETTLVAGLCEWGLVFVLRPDPESGLGLESGVDTEAAVVLDPSFGPESCLLRRQGPEPPAGMRDDSAYVEGPLMWSPFDAARQTSGATRP
jgi:hypothetical protein